MHWEEIRQLFTKKRSQVSAMTRRSLRYGLGVVNQLIGLKRCVVDGFDGKVF